MIRKAADFSDKIMRRFEHDPEKLQTLSDKIMRRFEHDPEKLQTLSDKIMRRLEGMIRSCGLFAQDHAIEKLSGAKQHRGDRTDPSGHPALPPGTIARNIPEEL
jgi:hypothetical protein